MKNQIVRASLIGYGEGWQWQVKDDDGNVTTYRTNNNSEGLWQCGSHTGNWAHNYEDHQIEGTCQFALPKEDYERARRIVKRYFARMID